MTDEKTGVAMSNRGTAAQRSRPHRGQVLRTQWIGPRMIRVVLGGGGLADFSDNGCTDRYVKLQFPRPGVVYDHPFDPVTARAELPREQWPVTRTYTVRHWNPETRELGIDFVHHGNSGVAGPWAARAKPGDLLYFGGPGGGYAPLPEADWHLLAGDESALPAIAASIAAMPADARGTAFVEVADSADEQELEAPDGVEIVWLRRGTGEIGERLTQVVTAARFPGERVQAFVHGEAHFVKVLRKHLRGKNEMERSAMSISGYWRRGADEDRWQATKHQWN